MSQRTCIREAIIRAIERDDFTACGGDFYARGHIRSIARAAGLDGTEAEALVREYDASHVPTHQVTAREIFEPTTPIKLRERRAPNWSIAMVVALAVVLGYGAYRTFVAASAPQRPVAAQGPRITNHHHVTAVHPPPSPTVQPTPTVHGLTIQLTAIQDCWVEFTRPNGTYMFQAYVVGGSSRTWQFHHAVSMQLGNPGGIVLRVDGRNLGHPGAYGQPVTLSFGPHKPLPTVTPGS
ncbi:MAG TPA: RodZ domain-containing protein, partial [Streptosporangiaceae bacterium]|nr:RodZ domain-containing protein [Streptosporangiaceae bacterium]